MAQQLAVTPILVPSDDRASVEWLARCSSSELERLVAAVSQAKVKPRGAFTAALTRDMAETTVDAGALAEALLGLNEFRLSTGAKVDETAASIAVSPDLKLSEDERESLSNAVTRILKTRTMAVHAKAVDLATEHQRIFAGVRLYTDVRPIYGDDVDHDPEGVVVFHTMKLDYWDGSRRSTMYVMLDDEDVDTFAKTLARASRKRDSLAIYLKNRNMPDLEAE